MSLDNAFFLNKDLGLPKLILFLKIVIDMDHTRCVNLNYSIAQIHSIMQNGCFFFQRFRFVPNFTFKFQHKKIAYIFKANNTITKCIPYYIKNQHCFFINVLQHIKPKHSDSVNLTSRFIQQLLLYSRLIHQFKELQRII